MIFMVFGRLIKTRLTISKDEVLHQIIRQHRIVAYDTTAIRFFTSPICLTCALRAIIDLQTGIDPLGRSNNTKDRHDALKLFRLHLINDGILVRAICQVEVIANILGAFISPIRELEAQSIHKTEVGLELKLLKEVNQTFESLFASFLADQFFEARKINRILEIHDALLIFILLTDLRKSRELRIIHNLLKLLKLIQVAFDHAGMILDHNVTELDRKFGLFFLRFNALNSIDSLKSCELKSLRSEIIVLLNAPKFFSWHDRLNA